MISWVYFYLVAFAIFDIFILMLGIEQIICFTRNMAPEVPSSKKLRNAIIKQISSDVPNPKSILDIGSGWGTMVKTIAPKFKNAQVYGVEIMPSPYIYSVIRLMFYKNIKIRFGNVFRFLDSNDKKYDVGIAYLLTPEMRKVEKYLSRFGTLLVLDFPLPNIDPSKKIKLHHDMFGQHWLYVYK